MLAQSPIRGVDDATIFCVIQLLIFCIFHMRIVVSSAHPYWTLSYFFDREIAKMLMITTSSTTNCAVVAPMQEKT